MSNIKIITGKRKTAIARVKMIPGTGKLIVNKRDAKVYFGRETYMDHAFAALKITNTLSKYDMSANICGGGLSGQAGALRLAIARSLVILEPNLRTSIKKDGLLTRDSRKVERKKPGLHKARKATQFSKR